MLSFPDWAFLVVRGYKALGSEDSWGTHPKSKWAFEGERKVELLDKLTARLDHFFFQQSTIIHSSKTRYWLPQQTWNTSPSSTHLQTLGYPPLLLWSGRFFIHMLLPLLPHHSCWLGLSNPTGNCINHSGKSKTKHLVNFYLHQYDVPTQNAIEKALFFWETQFESCQTRRHCHAAAHNHDYKFGFIAGTILPPSHTQRATVLALLWVDSLHMNNTVLSVRLRKMYIIRIMAYFLFLLLGGIQIRSPMGRHTLKCCWDQCGSATRCRTTEVCIKSSANVFNYFLSHISLTAETPDHSFAHTETYKVGNLQHVTALQKITLKTSGGFL